MNIDLTLYDASLIPAIMFLLMVLNKQGVPKRWIPVFSLALGILAALVIVEWSANGVIVGILLAANAVGFHSGTKNVFKSPTGDSNSES
ncbi:hypothetical protein [Marinicrinis sediminis]|uniref:Holin n=1 Tax=Marinicrinis sediminis TaxID=1652465 RepID=A0ABW5RDZ9_9BACL